ncbi:hypothetical protein SAMN04489717_4489 [Actinopolymorpha singaporensis]|uniref:Uncharacterized protein n=1 Tax=Actinopolymorpha singaporensis TaxID=117157 RepID=A0A1H1WEP2_9ACTN|nr:hypothetical protein SAMN04489717_4489 [Actinopolymorpha singaporensis]
MYRRTVMRLADAGKCPNGVRLPRNGRPIPEGNETKLHLADLS